MGYLKVTDMLCGIVCVKTDRVVSALPTPLLLPPPPCEDKYRVSTSKFPLDVTTKKHA